MIYETPTLETERLILKKSKYEDLVKVYEFDFRKLRDIAGEFEFVKQDPKELIGWDEPEEGVYNWVVFLKETNEPIADIVADREVEDIKAIELAFNTHPNYWRKGYTSEAIIEVMRFLFEKGYENILCGYDEGNFKSKGIGEKLGFVPYSVRKDAWEKNGQKISSYTSILSKERFNELYNKKIK